MRAAHRIVGLLFTAAFFVTGLWMLAHFPDAHGGDMGTRMMFRSAHVYILLSALVNLALGAHWTPREKAWRRRLQAVGSVLVLLAPPLFAAAFFVEPGPGRVDRPLSALGVLCTLVGMLLHTVASVEPRRR